MTRAVSIPAGRPAKGAPRRVAACLLAAIVGAAGAGAATTPSGANAVADAFYIDLMRSGAEAYSSQDFASAMTDLRLACFGFLDQPGLLAEGLVRLGLAQAAAADREGFLTTFGRLAEVERRFSAFSRGMLEAPETGEELRRSYETVALGLVPAAQHAALPGLSERAQSQAIADLGKLTPSKRRAELEKRAAAQPGDNRWPTLLAQLDLDQKKPAVAVKRLDAVLARAPGDADARCLRGRASADAGRCDAAIADLRLCPRSGQEASLAGRHLACLVEAKSWAEASTVLAGLSETVRKDTAIAKLAPKITAAAREPGTPPVVPLAKPPAVVKAPARPAVPPSSTAAPASARPSSGGKPPEVAAETSPPAQPATGTRHTATSVPPANPAGPSKPAKPPAPLGGKPGTVAPAVTGSASPASPTAARPPVSAPVSQPAAPVPAAPVAPAAPMSVDELAELERARQMLRSARVATDVEGALRIARVIADAHPADREAQLLTAEIAYRGSLWQDAVAYFDRADPGDKQPALLFYYAVALYESGNRPRAGVVLQRCLSKLQLTPVVQSYVERILGPGAASRARGVEASGGSS